MHNHSYESERHTGRHQLGASPAAAAQLALETCPHGPSKQGMPHLLHASIRHADIVGRTTIALRVGRYTGRHQHRASPAAADQLAPETCPHGPSQQGASDHSVCAYPGHTCTQASQAPLLLDHWPVCRPIDIVSYQYHHQSDTRQLAYSYHAALALGEKTTPKTHPASVLYPDRALTRVLIGVVQMVRSCLIASLTQVQVGVLRALGTMSGCSSVITARLQASDYIKPTMKKHCHSRLMQ